MITCCNEKTKNFSDTRKASERKLEDHYVSVIYDDVEALKDNIKDLNENIKHLKEGNPDDPNDMGIGAIESRIIENKIKMSASGIACEKINDQLKTFLGRDEITFEVSKKEHIKEEYIKEEYIKEEYIKEEYIKEEYIIKRNGDVAKNLSESEKTAIAFVYFTIHLEDQDFDINNGIVVIDDPISSLDSNSMFQSFAFLKNSVKDAHQGFMLTHNFEFLKLLLGWMDSKSKHSSYYMINNHYDLDNGRVARLDVLDNLLQKYDTEYQYLFKVLYNFESKGTIESVYHIPNIARKVLENFLAIMVPDSGNMQKKLEQIDFDENKKTAIYKFTNSQSHMTGGGFDPSLVPECQKNVKYLLEMMEEVFPKHFKVLQEAVNK
ncbi:AAA family ATPase [Candidatus Spongiihabitans sp.]|uniref:AAA family ATPase n=1 Tax=Candidatus Spongiihabitans sp. TaxID=3101308 RepID=UPI003C7C14A3